MLSTIALRAIERVAPIISKPLVPIDVSINRCTSFSTENRASKKEGGKEFEKRRVDEKIKGVKGNPGGKRGFFSPPLLRLGMLAILFSLAQTQSIHLVRCPFQKGTKLPSIHVHAFIIRSGVPFSWEYDRYSYHERSRRSVGCLLFAASPRGKGFDPWDRSAIVRISRSFRYFLDN